MDIIMVYLYLQFRIFEKSRVCQHFNPLRQILTRIGGQAITLHVEMVNFEGKLPCRFLLCRAS